MDRLSVLPRFLMVVLIHKPNRWSPSVSYAVLEDRVWISSSATAARIGRRSSSKRAVPRFPSEESSIHQIHPACAIQTADRLRGSGPLVAPRRSPHNKNSNARMSETAAVLNPTLMMPSSRGVPRALPAANGTIDPPAAQIAPRKFANQAARQPYTSSRNVILDEIFPSFSLGQSRPTIERKVPCMIPSKCADNANRGNGIL